MPRAHRLVTTSPVWGPEPDPPDFPNGLWLPGSELGLQKSCLVLCTGTSSGLLVGWLFCSQLFYINRLVNLQKSSAAPRRLRDSQCQGAWSHPAQKGHKLSQNRHQHQKDNLFFPCIGFCPRLATQQSQPNPWPQTTQKGIVFDIKLNGIQTGPSQVFPRAAGSRGKSAEGSGWGRRDPVTYQQPPSCSRAGAWPCPPYNRRPSQHFVPRSAHKSICKPDSHIP